MSDPRKHEGSLADVLFGTGVAIFVALFFLYLRCHQDGWVLEIPR